MSYCRFATKYQEGGRTVESDVYVFHCVPSETYKYGHLECCACRLLPTRSLAPRWRFNERTKQIQSTKRLYWTDWFGNYETASRGEMILHLYDHRDAGHHVPRWAFERLYKELDEVGDHIRYRGW